MNQTATNEPDRRVTNGCADCGAGRHAPIDPSGLRCRCCSVKLEEFTEADLQVIADRFDGKVVTDDDGDRLVEVMINGTPTICRARRPKSVRS